MTADKDYCASPFLAFRYIFDDEKGFAPRLKHRTYKQHPDEKKTFVRNAGDVDAALEKTFDALKGKRLGILLSGRMDSAILASYMPGCDAYTFRFMDGDFQKDELKTAETFAHMLDMSKFSGNQKWLLWVLERFLNVNHL